MNKYKEKVFFFDEGEVIIYDKPSGTKTKAIFFYKDLLAFVKEGLYTYKKRPKFMQDIWPLVAIYFECECYSVKYNHKTKINKFCFETKFTTEISYYLDEKFPRTFSSEEEKKKKQRYYEENAPIISTYMIKNHKNNLMKKKLGGKLY